MRDSYLGIQKEHRLPASTIARIFVPSAHALLNEYRPVLRGRVILIDDAHPYGIDKPGWMVVTDFCAPGYPIAAITEGMTAEDIVKMIDGIPGSEDVHTIISDGGLNIEGAIEILRKRGRKIKHVIDRFHAVRMFSFALEDLTKAAANQGDARRGRKLQALISLFKSLPDDLIEVNNAVLHAAAALNTDILRAVEIYRSLLEFYDPEDVREARGKLASLKIKHQNLRKAGADGDRIKKSGEDIAEAEARLAALKAKRNDRAEADARLASVEANFTAASPLVQECFLNAINYIKRRREAVLNFFPFEYTNGPAEMNNRRFKPVMAFSKGCPFEVIAVRVMYDSGSFDVNYHFRRIAYRIAPPLLLKALPEELPENSAAEETFDPPPTYVEPIQISFGPDF